jgi:hypothetical protein
LFHVLISAGHSVTDVLVESAQTLADVCDHVLDTFDAAEQRYNQQHPSAAAAASSGVHAMEE